MQKRDSDDNEPFVYKFASRDAIEFVGIIRHCHSVFIFLCFDTQTDLFPSRNQTSNKCYSEYVASFWTNAYNYNYW